MPRVRETSLRQPRDVSKRPSRLKLLLRRQRRFLRPALWGLAGFGVVMVGIVLVHSAQPGGTVARIRDGIASAANMRVRDIVIEGRNNTPQPLLDAALGVKAGDSMLGFSIGSARQRLETLSWVEHATVERRLPGTLVVNLVERRPYAIWQHEGKFVLIDRDGQVVANEDVAAFGELPLVVGPGAPEAATALLEATGRPAAAKSPRGGRRARGRAPLEPADEERHRRAAAGGRRAAGTGQARRVAIRRCAAGPSADRGGHAAGRPAGGAPASSAAHGTTG